MLYLPRLTSIKPAELGSGAESLAQRMEGHLKVAAVAIEECSHVTNEYYKMKIIRMYPDFSRIMESVLTAIQAKLIKSSKWEEKFTAFATKFANFQSDFTADLALYTGAGIQATFRAVGKIDDKISMFMKAVFTLFASPEENQLLSFIKSEGGPEVFITDDNLLRDLIKKYNTQQRQTSQEDDRVGQGKARFDLGNSEFDDTKKELNADLDVVLARSKKFFAPKFQEQKDQIEKVRDDIRREGDRIVGQLLSGAHDRILDKVGLRSLFIATTLT